MLTDAERFRFNLLRDRQASGETLSPEKEAEVAALVARIESAEPVLLAPAIERLRRENETSARRLRALELLAEREERLLERVSRTVREIEAEQAAISAERELLLTEPAPLSLT